MPVDPEIYGPELLRDDHRVDGFTCGKPALDEYLHRFALANQKGGGARTYVVCREMRVVGYHSLAPGSVGFASAPERIVRGQARHPVPVVLLARLAVDRAAQGNGLGKHLLLDAFQRAVAGAEVIGGRALLIHAKDDEAKRFYSSYGAVASPTDPLHLFLLMKDLRRALEVEPTNAG